MEVSPLSKNKASDPAFVERFEIYVAGMEIGNAYTELNDPAGAVPPLRAASCELRPPATKKRTRWTKTTLRACPTACRRPAAKGIGIDRLTMILTNSKSIRDVILFPLLRPEGEIGIAEKLKETEVRSQESE